VELIGDLGADGDAGDAQQAPQAIVALHQHAQRVGRALDREAS
jgi:hypothetical protein